MSTERYPHRRARDERYRHYCACGDSVPEEMFASPASPLSPSYTWGSDCSAALREHIAELEAALANERGEGEPPVEGWESVDFHSADGRTGEAWRRGDVVVLRLDPRGPWRVYDVDGTMFSPVLDDNGRPVESPTARAAMLAAFAARST